jgi:hypothetical protein
MPNKIPENNESIGLENNLFNTRYTNTALMVCIRTLVNLYPQAFILNKE